MGNGISFTIALCISAKFLVKKNVCRDFPGGTVVKHLPANAGDMGLIPGLG